ncbi:MAG: long-chain fatty acid--CoA ligase [Acidobacteria bacterium]|nr:long-chain fatty acid--CoA ligase [Acidobacteriota bacterium]
MIDFLLDALDADPGRLAIADRGGAWTSADVKAAITRLGALIDAGGPVAGRVVSLEAEYGLEAVAAFLALTARSAIIVPLSQAARAHHESFLETAQVEVRVTCDDTAPPRVAATGRTAAHPIYDILKGRGTPGLVLFSSGSTGAPKAAVHDLERLLRKFKVRKRAFRTIVFLQLDHIGGVNTLLYTLSNAGAIIVPADRSPAGVCRAIAEHQGELLPTSPTFLNLLLISGAIPQHDLSSLRLITYGTEPMPASTLTRVAEVFPTVKLQQTYGSTEIGILRSESRGQDSLWVRVGGEGFETKVVDGRLWVRAESAMLGYLNAPSPFSADGFYDTGDLVEVDGEWLRILGRKSDVINVGGSKVHPAEVESTLLMMEGVDDAAVSGEPNALTGHIVTATVRLSTGETLTAFKGRMRAFCKDRLESYKVPAKVRLAEGPLYSERFKRMR